MEQWQINHISGKLSELLKNTKWNPALAAILVQTGVLDDAEIDKLNTISTGKSETEACAHLYCIIQIKTYGYEVLTAGLRETCQSGAYTILKNGYRFKLLNLIQQLIPFYDMDGVIAILENGEVRHEFEETFVPKYVSGESNWFRHFRPFVLVNQTIPEVLPTYIPRLISNRIIIDPKIFECTECVDVFVFKGVTQTEVSRLSRLSGNCSIMSGRKRLFPESNARFIYLEEDEDWQELSKTNVHPIHLISVEKNHNGLEADTNYILEETTGNSVILWNYQLESETTKESAYISEEDLVHKLMHDKCNKKVVCICDGPGMGKSWLLGSLANQFQKLVQTSQNSNKIVGFISLQHLSEVVLKSFSISEMNSKTALQCVLEGVCSGKLSREILGYALNKKWVYLCIFLDGFDEVAGCLRKITELFLKMLVENSELIQVFVTSRKHAREELEQNLGVVAYDILPFSQCNQIDYLTNSWRERFRETDITLLQKFASVLLKKLRDGWTKDEKNVLGNPLMCYLVAEVFAEHAKIYGKRKLDSDNDIKISCAYKMYEKLFQLRLSYDGVLNIRLKNFLAWKAFDVLFPNFAHWIKPILVLPEEPSDSELLACGILHRQKHGNLVFLDFVHITFAEYLVAEFFGKNLFQNLAMTHAMEQNRTASFFVNHILDIKRNFREKYGWIGNIRKLQRDLRMTNSFNMYTFPCYEILSFLNSNLNLYCQCHIENLKLLHTQNNFLTEKLLASPANLMYILQCCIFHNFLDLFRALVSLLKLESQNTLNELRNLFGEPSVLYHKGSSGLCCCNKLSHVSLEYPKNFSKVNFRQNLNSCLSVTGSYFLIMSVATYSESEMLDTCFDFLHHVFKPSDNIFCDIYKQGQPSPLSVVMKRHNYYLLEAFLRAEDKYLYKQSHFRELYEFVSNSNSLSDEEIRYAENMCILMLDYKPELTNERDEFGRNILQSPNMHLNLLKTFISRKADITATINYNQTFIHLVIDYMDSERFHDLCKYLFRESATIGNVALKRMAQDLFRKYIDNESNLICFILVTFKGKLFYKTLEMLLDATKMNINNLFLGGRFGTLNLLMAALLGNQSMDLLIKLVNLGINVAYKNENNLNALRIAVNQGNIQIADMFLSLGLPITPEEIQNDLNNQMTIFAIQTKISYKPSKLCNDEYVFPNSILPNKMVNYLIWRGFDLEKIGNANLIYTNTKSLCTSILRAVCTIQKISKMFPKSYQVGNIGSEVINWRDANEFMFLEYLPWIRKLDISARYKMLEMVVEDYKTFPTYLLNILDIDATKRVNNKPTAIEIAGEIEAWDTIKYIFLLDMELTYLQPHEMISLYENLKQTKKICSIDLPNENVKPTFANIKLLLTALLEFFLRVPESDSGNTYFHYASGYYNESSFNNVIQTLQEHDLVNILCAKNQKGQTPLHLAISFDCFGLATFDILEGFRETRGSGQEGIAKHFSVNWNDPDNDGHSYIHYALFRPEHNTKFIERLVKLEGMDLSVVDRENRSITDICQQLCLPNHLKMFESFGCKLQNSNCLITGDHFMQFDKFFQYNILPRKYFESEVAKLNN